MLLNEAGCYLHHRGQFGLAEPLYRKAIAVFRQVLGEQHPNFAIGLNNLAELCDATGRYQGAEPLYRRSTGRLSQSAGRAAPDSAKASPTWQRCTTRAVTRRPSRYSQAMAIRSQVLGDHHPDFAQSLNNLAVAVRLDGP